MVWLSGSWDGEWRKFWREKNKIKQAHTLLTLHQTPICPPFKETWIFLIPSLIKITYIKECVRLHQGFHLFYNEVNAETQWLPQQCKWRPNDNLHYLNKVIAITLRYSNEDRCFELSALNPLLLLQNIWKRWRRIDFGIIQCVPSNSTWCKPRAMSEAKSLNVVVQDERGGGQLGKTFKVVWLTTLLYSLWKTLRVGEKPLNSLSKRGGERRKKKHISNMKRILILEEPNLPELYCWN